MTKICHPINLVSVPGKVFEKLINNRLVDHQSNVAMFPDFQYGFRSFQSSADILTVVFDELLGLLGFCILIFFTNLNLMEFWVRYFTFFHFSSVKGSFK